MAKSLPTALDSQGSKKSRKKSTKGSLVEPEDVTATPKDTISTAGPSTQVAKPSGPDGIDTETIFENKKAQKRAIRAARHRVPTEDGPSSSLEVVENGQKRKHGADEGDGDSNKSQGPGASTEEPPKKKHKNRTEFADPRSDESLNPQSRKALEYAFTQMNKPSKWKFNKARQNWLIRNVWAPELLPEIYIPLVWKYLASVQGGSRQKLKEACQSYLKVEEKTEPETEAEINEKETTTATAKTHSSHPPPPPLKSILKPTAGPLITPGPLIDTPSTSAPESGNAAVTDENASSEGSLSPGALIDVRRTRARELLEILGSS